MASPDPRKVIRGLTGALCTDPTDLTTDFPHGGTALGLVRDMVFKPGERQKLITAEEFGQVVREAYRIQDSPILTAVLREWDDDALSTIYPDTEDGDSNRTLIQGRASRNTSRSGSKLSDSAVKLVFSPDSPDQHPFIVIYKAIPVALEVALDLRLDREIGHPFGCYGIPDASFDLYQVGFRTDVSL